MVINRNCRSARRGSIRCARLLRKSLPKPGANPFPLANIPSKLSARSANSSANGREVSAPINCRCFLGGALAGQIHTRVWKVRLWRKARGRDRHGLATVASSRVTSGFLTPRFSGSAAYLEGPEPPVGPVRFPGGPRLGLGPGPWRRVAHRKERRHR